MEFTFEFIRLFLLAADMIMPLLISLSLSVVILGQVVGYIEGWNKFDSLYWSFITALTVGYGDIRPLKRRSKALSVMVGLTGIMFTGLIVAITVHTATIALKGM
ncbi:MAG: potassium channel family protein [Desulfobacteraceae bacterium]|nr:potassium channel family protein [Desulfobacteraceae bacterium]